MEILGFQREIECYVFKRKYFLPDCDGVVACLVSSSPAGSGYNKWKGFCKFDWPMRRSIQG